MDGVATSSVGSHRCVRSQAIAPTRAASQRLVAALPAPYALVSEEDWRAVQETLFLVSIPGMRESIREGLATPIDDLEDEPGW